jgi:glycosyltransferase
MKVSVITAVFNNKQYIGDCIKSVVSQTYPDIEYIIIDGGSTDGTLDVISRLTHGGSNLMRYEGGVTNLQTRAPRVISEPDNGIYDALNKGIRLATGDVIGFLHADDIYADASVIGKVAAAMSRSNADSCYGDLLYVDKNNPERIIRYWKSRPYEKGMFGRGWMPPHPTFFVRKEIYERYGSFNTDFRIASDYELMLRFLEKEKISTWYIPEVLIKMRTGGASNRSVKNMVIKTTEDYKAWRVNHLREKFYTIPFKNLSKIPQFFVRRGVR